MKRFLLTAFLLFCALCARAQSSYAGKYYALSYSRGDVVAAVDFKVKKDRTVKGRGFYTDFYSINVRGQVKDDGMFTINETGARPNRSYSGVFSASGKKFKAVLSTGNVVQGKRVPNGFPQAGAYYARTDQGLLGLFIVENSRQVRGAVYDSHIKEVIPVTGMATSESFSGSTEDGVSFMGDFEARRVSGSYSDGQGSEGTFSGYRL